MFELQTFTKTRFLDVRVLSKKDRKPDEPAGAQILARSTLAAGDLAMFDGFLPGMLYRKPRDKKQGEIEGVESAELTAIGEHIKRLRWDYDQTGNTVTIDYGTGGPSTIVLNDCRVHRVSFEPQKGGGVNVQWTIDAPGLSDETRGRLTGLKSTDMPLKQIAPTVADDPQQDIEGPKGDKPTKRTKPAPVIDGTKGHPGATEKKPDATDEFIARNTGTPAPVH